MRKIPCLPLILLALPVLVAGCQTTKTARTKPRYYENQGSFGDSSARSTYMNRRIEELTDTGLSKKDAAARASKEWFSRAPVASESPTYYELQRRQTQAEFVSYLDKQKDTGTR